MIIGIDLGTTNSLVACYTEEGPVIIPNRLGKRLTRLWSVWMKTIRCMWENLPGRERSFTRKPRRMCLKEVWEASRSFLLEMKLYCRGAVIFCPALIKRRCPGLSWRAGDGGGDQCSCLF